MARRRRNQGGEGQEPEAAGGDARGVGGARSTEHDEADLARRLRRLLEGGDDRTTPHPLPDEGPDDPTEPRTWLDRVLGGVEPSALGRAFGSLTDDQRDALALTVWSGMDARFVGGVLDLSPAAAEDLIRNAGAALRARFAELDVGGVEGDGVDVIDLLAAREPNVELGPVPDRPRLDVGNRRATSRWPGARQPRRVGRFGQRWVTLSRRARVVLAAGAAVVVLGSATAAAVVLTRNPSSVSIVSCYEAFTLHPSRIEVVPAVPAGPVAACTPLWTDGGSFAVPGTPIPPLTACVLPGGPFGVFPDPAGYPCSELGLATPTVDGAAEDQKVLDVDQQLEGDFSARCVSVAAGVGDARNALAMAGLSGWAVQAEPSRGPSYVCSSLAVDQPAKVIKIVPLPRSSV